MLTPIYTLSRSYQLKWYLVNECQISKITKSYIKKYICARSCNTVLYNLHALQPVVIKSINYNHQHLYPRTNFPQPNTFFCRIKQWLILSIYSSLHLYIYAIWVLCIHMHTYKWGNTKTVFYMIKILFNDIDQITKCHFCTVFEEFECGWMETYACISYIGDLFIFIYL